MSKVDIGFPAGKKRQTQPYELGIRCDDETVRHLEIVKSYLLENEQPAENTSEVVRKAILFGSIWARQMLADKLRREVEKADKCMEELVAAEKAEPEAKSRSPSRKTRGGRKKAEAIARKKAEAGRENE
jgi:hypothetical protein